MQVKKWLRKIKKDFILTCKLAKNDFTTKYSGNYLGIVWGFVQPMITILIYIFIFQVGFRAADAKNGYPYALWLISGIIAWFYFAEAMVTSTNAFLEYGYLVKKVVFEVYTLPLVKVFSALFVHIFFVVITFFIFMINGTTPGIQVLQVFYYMFCMICLVSVLSYITASIVPFFKDFGQIVSVIVQIGMWLTPIMWNFEEMSERLGRWSVLFKLNPMFYVVQGYRNSYMGGKLFWEEKKALFFWLLILILGVLGRICYKKMKPHFADVI